MEDALANITQQIQGTVDGNMGSLADLTARAKSASTTLQNIDTTKMIQSQTTINTDSTLTDADTDYAHVDYYNKISSYAMLRDSAVMRNISHNFAMEYLMMLCASGKESQITQYIYKYCGRDYTWQNPSDANNLDKAGISELFMKGTNADIDAQHDVNLTLLDVEFQARKQYLAGQLSLIESMVLQQEALIQSLGDWSHYLDQQAQEYAEIYERLNVLMNTNKRKDVFEVKDLQSLDKWNTITVNAFWVLLVILIVMIVVQNYSSITSSLNNAQQKIQSIAEQTIVRDTQSNTK